MTWRPYLPDPRPAFKMNPDEPEPVPLEVLQALRELCASFLVPPRQFRRRVGKDGAHYHPGIYYHQTDIVAVDPDRAATHGMGGEDGYYACLMHELLHTTGHPSRLNRESLRDESSEGFALEEGTVMAAERIVLEAVGFNTEALDWFAPSALILDTFGPAPVDHDAARVAADWVLDSRAFMVPPLRTGAAWLPPPTPRPTGGKS